MKDCAREAESPVESEFSKVGVDGVDASEAAVV